MLIHVPSARHFALSAFSAVNQKALLQLGACRYVPTTHAEAANSRQLAIDSQHAPSAVVAHRRVRPM